MIGRKQPRACNRYGRAALAIFAGGWLLLSASVLVAATPATAEVQSDAKKMAAQQQQRAYLDQWGPAIGSVIEPLAAQDQQGTVRKLPSLAGPNGLLLFLVRSADW